MEVLCPEKITELFSLVRRRKDSSGIFLKFDLCARVYTPCYVHIHIYIMYMCKYTCTIRSLIDFGIEKKNYGNPSTVDEPLSARYIIIIMYTYNVHCTEVVTSEAGV